ncbi:MAG: hypothetical protein ACI4F4_04695 [Lachnospiraceae bacterium]
MNWKYKKYVTWIIIILIFISYCLVILSYQIQIKSLTGKYEDQINELQSMVSISNIIESSELQYDIYDNAREFLTYYYGISEDVSQEFRRNKLESLMTEQAINHLDLDTYENMYGYESNIDNIHIYIDEENATNTSVTACIFFDENIKWPNINVITNPKLWIGEFDKIDNVWKVNQVISYQQLISEQEYNALNLDTNGMDYYDSSIIESSLQEEKEDEK